MQRKNLVLAPCLMVGFLVGPALAEPGLSVPTPDGFVLARDAVDPHGRRMAEFVPEGESVWDWSRRLSVQAVPRSRDAMGYARSVAGSLTGACAGSEASAPAEGTLDGIATATIVVTCPSASDGAPETVMLRAVATEATLHVVEWSWDGARPDAAELDRAARHLDALSFCDDDASTGACPAG